MTEEKKKKRAKAVTMTKRSMDFLRALGYQVAVVERWFEFPERRNGIPTGKRIKQRLDCFGFADLVAVHPEIKGTMYVQTTSASNHAARRAKVLQSNAVLDILKSGNQIVVHGWSKKGGRGVRKLWQVSESQIYINDATGNLAWRTQEPIETSETGEPEPSLFNDF